MFPTPLLLRAGVIVAMLAAVGFAGWEVVHSIQAGAVKDLRAQDATLDAQAKAAGAAADAKQASITAETAQAAAAHQADLTVQAAVIKQKVHKHVPPPPAPDAPPPVPGCVTYGLVRDHDAAALGVDPDTLPLPAGSGDDTCAPVTNADLADAIADNYAAARANAQELTDLQADVSKRAAGVSPSATSANGAAPAAVLR